MFVLYNRVPLLTDLCKWGKETFTKRAPEPHIYADCEGESHPCGCVTTMSTNTDEDAQDYTPIMRRKPLYNSSG